MDSELTGTDLLLTLIKTVSDFLPEPAGISTSVRIQILRLAISLQTLPDPTRPLSNPICTENPTQPDSSRPY